MVIKSHLFADGPLTNRAGLLDLLMGHEHQTISHIKEISSLDQMTEDFLARLVKDSLVEPIQLHFDGLTYQLRTEEFDGSEFPFGFHVYQGKRYPKQVARISVPFSGDQQLLKYTPATCMMNFPLGQVAGRTICYDVILWGLHNDESLVKEQVDRNNQLLQRNADNSAGDVRRFNESLPTKVKAAFTTKFEELAKQHSIFGGLGIKPQEPVQPAYPLPSPAKSQKLKKERPQPTQIIQYIENMYVQELNQTNNNEGDVNNAIQSN